MSTYTLFYKAISVLISTSLLLSSFSPINAIPVQQGNVVNNISNTANSYSALDANGNLAELEGLLLNIEAMQTSTSQQTEPNTSKINISRLLSHPTHTGSVSTTLTVTYTIENPSFPINLPSIDEANTVTDTLQTLGYADLTQDQNAIHNVVVVNTLDTSQAQLLSSSHPMSQQDGALIWNFGTLAPKESKTFTLVFQVFEATSEQFFSLDTGATVWGTYQNEPTTNTTAPITLAPSSYLLSLACTIDANCADPYVINKASELGNDPQKIFDYVRSLKFESYKGSLRGARGTLWSEGGNSLDQANLLIALLRASGIPANYKKGILTDLQAQQLINTMFPIAQTTVGTIPADSERGEPPIVSIASSDTPTWSKGWTSADLTKYGWQTSPIFGSTAVSFI